MSTKNLIMSMSGTRGIVGETMTPVVALKMGMAFGAFLGKGPVVVGGDTRTSHDMLKQAVISGLMSVGTDVIDIGKVLTPTVQQMIRHFSASGGIVVTASHNPVVWNGLKLMNHTGSFLEDAQYEAFSQWYDRDDYPFVAWDSVGQLIVEERAVAMHIDYVLSCINTDVIRNSGLRVLVDANNGAGAMADMALLTRLGVAFRILNGEPHGRFAHDPEPLEKNLTEIVSELSHGGFDIGFVQDADADRLVILDETGRFIGEDYSLGLCVDYILSDSASPGDCVVVNLSTSKVIEDIAARYGVATHYTKIGETHVTQGIKSHRAIVGGEGNGGVIYPTVGWGRDSLVGIVVALKSLATSRKKVSEIVAGFPVYRMLREKIALSERGEVAALLDTIKAKFPGQKMDTQDGVKLYFDHGWVHVRPSNTEPIVRIFVEAPTVEACRELFDMVI